MYFLKSIRIAFIAFILAGICIPLHSASKYPKTTLYILYSAKKKLKKSNTGRKNVKEISFKSAAGALKREMTLLIKGKRLDEAKRIRDLIKEIEKATPGEEIMGGNITPGSKKIVQEMNKRCINADSHHENNRENQ